MDEQTLQAFEQLASLRSDGVLSEEEFLLAKKRLLEQSANTLIASSKNAEQVENGANNSSAGKQSVVISDYHKAPTVPDGVPWVVMYRGGRIKGQGVSLSGLELMTLIFTSAELIVFGRSSRELWRKPLKGMTAEKQSVDGVRFKSVDGESIDWMAKGGTRKKLLEAFRTTQQAL